jgi:hypothetical protein
LFAIISDGLSPYTASASSSSLLAGVGVTVGVLVPFKYSSLYVAHALVVLGPNLPYPLAGSVPNVLYLSCHPG